MFVEKKRKESKDKHMDEANKLLVKRVSTLLLVFLLLVGLAFLILYILDIKPFDTKTVTGEVIAVPCGETTPDCIKVRYFISEKYKNNGDANGSLEQTQDFGVMKDRKLTDYKVGDKVKVVYYKEKPTQGYVK